MTVNDSIFYREAEKFISVGASFGWHERNAGNISLLLNDSEAASVKENFSNSGEWRTLPYPVCPIGGRYIFTTASGSYFTDIDANCFSICEIDSKGENFRVVWGSDRPTSELNGHLMSLSALTERSDGFRAVYHCHPADLIALTYILDNDDKTFSELLWKSETECAFVFPNGLGVVGFEVPGSVGLAEATAEKMRYRDAVVWSFHGLFSAGISVKDAFGRAHAIAKAAEIRLKIISSGAAEKNSITDRQLLLTAETFGCELRGLEK